MLRFKEARDWNIKEAVISSTFAGNIFYNLIPFCTLKVLYQIIRRHIRLRYETDI